MKTETVVLKAALTSVVWRNERRIIAKVKPHGRRETTVIGDMMEPHIGQMYEFTGTWKHNERFGGNDLHFSAYRTILPDDHAGVYHYLVHTAKWIGPETATKLIECFGGNTLSVLRESPDWVQEAQIKGLTPTRIREISTTLRENEALEASMVEVGNMIGGLLGQSVVSKALAKWGADAGHVIRHNAFRLMALNSVGFAKADSLYLKLGGRVDALRRHAHAAGYVLSEQAGRHGHTVVSRMRFDTELVKLVSKPHPKLMELCFRAGRVLTEEASVCDGALHRAETFVADKVRLLETQAPDERINTLARDDVDKFCHGLAPDQLDAFGYAIDCPVCIITGAPGTGKTYVIARIIAAWKAIGFNVNLAAPTGKAAKQMELALRQTVSLPARTIHSLLEAEMVDGEFRFTRGPGNPLECSALVIDETSMVDVRLMRSLLAAVPDGCRLLLVGDHYQLPSVGPGAVLRDLLTAGVPSVELRTIKRNAGLIVRACHAIKDGRRPTPADKLDLVTGANWRHVESPSAEHTKAIITALLETKLRALEPDLDLTWDVQTISPTNEAGPLSCKALNRVAKQVLNPLAHEAKLPFAAGDKVVRLKNGLVKALGGEPCPVCSGSGKSTNKGKCLVCLGQGTLEEGGEIRVVNGDIGVVQEISSRYVDVSLRWPDRLVRLPRVEHQLRMAYCMTCHKMQGSEVPIVILPIHKSLIMLPMVTREWLYTAFSRAKKFIITVGDLGEMPRAIARIGNNARTTALAELLTERKSI